LTLRRLLRKRVGNESKRKLENEKLRAYGSGSVGNVVAELMTVAVDVGVVNLDAVGFGAPALLLDVTHLITAACRLVVRWIRIFPLVVGVEDATEMTNLKEIVHQETARYLYPGLAHALFLVLGLQLPPYAAEEAMRSQDLEEIGPDRGPGVFPDVFLVLVAEGEGFQVVVIHEHAPFLLLRRLAHVHLEDPGGKDLPHSHPAAALRPLLLGTIVVAGKNTIGVDVHPNHDQDLVL
jgi:hypothetical protein